jgi:hypothetical protein
MEARSNRQLTAELCWASAVEHSADDAWRESKEKKRINVEIEIGMRTQYSGVKQKIGDSC